LILLLGLVDQPVVPDVEVSTAVGFAGLDQRVTDCFARIAAIAIPEARAVPYAGQPEIVTGTLLCLT
jgi:hypothetical protein